MHIANDPVCLAGYQEHIIVAFRPGSDEDRPIARGREVSRNDMEFDDLEYFGTENVSWSGRRRRKLPSRWCRTFCTTGLPSFGLSMATSHTETDIRRFPRFGHDLDSGCLFRLSIPASPTVEH